MPFDFGDAPDTVQPGRVAPYEPTPDELKRPPAREPSSFDTFGAFMRRENLLGSSAAFISRGGLEQKRIDPDYDVLAKIRGTKYESRMIEFVRDSSDDEVARTKARIDLEDKDTELVGNSGLPGFAYGIVAGVLDPTIALPAGGFVMAGKGGYRVARSALSVGGAAAAGVAIQEAVLQGTQSDRSGVESAINIASAGILGGILGGGASAFMSNAERRLAAQLLDRDREDISRTVGQPVPPKAPEAAAPATVAPDGTARVADETPPEPAVNLGHAADGSPIEVPRVLPGEAQGTAGAAFNTQNLDNRTLTLKGYLLDSVPGLNRVVANMSPTLRTFTQPIMEARRVMGDLAETALVFVENSAGVPTATRGGPVDRLVRNQINAARMAVEPELDRLWLAHRFGTAEAGYARIQASKLAADVQALMSEVEGGKLNFDAFKREIGRAMRRGDVHPIPEVQQAADLIRKQVFEPWFNKIKGDPKLREAFGWPENMDVKTAESYFSRVYNREAIRQNKLQVQDQVLRWLIVEQDKKIAIHERLQGLQDQLNAVRSTLAKIDAREERLDARRQALETRLDERGREVQRTIARAEDLGRRSAEIDDEIADLNTFIEETKGIVTDPETKALIASMEEDLKTLRQMDRGMTLEDLEAADVAERGAILAGPMRRVANIMAGRERTKKPPNFLHFIARNGGVKDTNGNVRAIIGDPRRFPGLINNQSGRDLDQWGEFLANEFGRRDGDLDFLRYDEDEVAAMIGDAARGRQPDDWLNSLAPKDQERVEAYRLAGLYQDLFERLGIPDDAVKSPRDFADILAGNSTTPRTYEALDRELAEMEAAGEWIPASMRREDVAERLAYTRADIAKARQMIAEARRERGSMERRGVVARAREGEARVAENANLGRYGVIEQQLSRAETKQAILDSVRANAERVHDQIRKDIEDQITQWRGKSSVEAIRAIEAAAKADEARQAKIGAGFMYGQLYKGDGKRLTSADAAVDRAVRHILDKDPVYAPEELRQRANEIVERLVAAPEGRIPYDVASPSFGKAIPQSEVRGALAAREFMIPDEMLDTIPDGRGGNFSVLEDDVEAVIGSYLNTVVTDVHLVERFGDTRMTEAFRRIDEDANRMLLAATSQKERDRITKAHNKVKADIVAVRDRIRGVYALPANEQMRNAYRLAAAVKNYNVITDLGGATLNSLGEIAMPVFRYGFMKVFGTGYGALVQGIQGNTTLYAAAKTQLKKMGIVNEVWMNSRVQSLGDIVEPYRQGTLVERGLFTGANASQILNLNAHFTDHNRAIAGMLAMDEILLASKAVAAGKATKKQIQNLAASSIDENMARAIWRQFENGGGGVHEGVHLPNTADWSDGAARTAFEGAVAREVDIAVINPGQEKPLWLSNPILSIFGQFRTFVASANERILIAQLQQRDGNTLAGLVSAVAGGMMSYVAYSVATNQFDKLEKAKPADYLREGISRSGVLGWFEEINTNLSKATGNRADAYRLLGSEKPLSKYSSRSPLGQLLGPTAGKIEGVLDVARHAAAGEWREADTRNVRRLAPFQNLIGLRLLLDQVEKGVNGIFGVPERAVR